ncbi:MAG: hypothetical protein R3E68_06530 [Burkholderiaceae bacterium]
MANSSGWCGTIEQIDEAPLEAKERNRLATLAAGGRPGGGIAAATTIARR